MTIIDNIIILFSSYKIDYHMLSTTYIEQWNTAANRVCAIIFTLFALGISLYAYSAAAKKFQKQHPDEKIIYIIKNNPLFIIVFSYIWGGCFGKYMLAGIWFYNFYTDNIIGMGNIIDYIFFFIATCFIIYRYSIIYVISNRQIKLISAYSIFNIITKKISIPFEKIKSVKFNSFLCFETLEIIFKQGGGYDGITCFTGLKKAKSIIDKLLYEGITNN